MNIVFTKIFFLSASLLFVFAVQFDFIQPAKKGGGFFVALIFLCMMFTALCMGSL